MRPLGTGNNKAFALINALDDGQRKQAILTYKVADLVLGPGQDGKTIQPEGLKASAMNASQQSMLLDLVSESGGIVNEQAATASMAEIKANIAETYYRIQGPTLVIEYAPQPLGGDPTNHIHTIYRGADERLREEVGGAVMLRRAAASALIGVTPNGVDVEISLTPGVAVLPAVMAAIDRDHDGRISPAEEQAYAGDVMQDVELRVDGKPVPLRLISTRYPSAEAMKAGLRTIRLNLSANHSGHELRFENRHMPRASVYLVNCLASPDNFADASGKRAVAGWPAQGALGLAVIGMLALGRLALRRT